MADKQQVKSLHGEIRGDLFFSAKKRDSLSADLYIRVAGHQIQTSSCLRSLGLICICSLKMG